MIADLFILAVGACFGAGIAHTVLRQGIERERHLLTEQREYLARRMRADIAESDQWASDSQDRPKL